MQRTSMGMSTYTYIHVFHMENELVLMVQIVNSMCFILPKNEVIFFSRIDLLIFLSDLILIMNINLRFF